MLLRDLFEDSEQDVSASQLGDKLRTALYGYIYNLRQEKGDDAKLGAVVPIDGKEYPCMPVSDLSQRYRFRDLQDVLIVFRPQEEGQWSVGGYAQSLRHPVNGINYLVVIDCFGETLRHLQNSLGADRVAHVFRHELQHILDFKRYKNDEFRPGRTSKSNYKRAEEDERAYHNHPLERNAYWHNLAEPILNNLRFMAGYINDPEMWELLSNNIPRDFSEFLKTAMLRAPGATKNNMARLSKQNRKRAIARLYQLHQYYFRLRDAAMAKSSADDSNEKEAK